MTLNKIFAQRLREERQRWKLPISTLAELCGTTRQAWYSYEAGTRMPSAETLAYISEYTGVLVDYYLGLTDEKTLPSVTNS